MKNKRHSSKSIHQTLSALLILLAIYAVAAAPRAVRAQTPPASKAETASRADEFGEKFREGRNLIDRQEWARAAEKFREAVEKYPDHKSADVALYWLAFSHKKQKQYREADAALDRLLEKFPSSPWAGDARVMKMEISAPLGRAYLPGEASLTYNSAAGQQIFSQVDRANAVKGTVTGSGQYTALADKLKTAGQVPLDREDELKLAAFQSLLAADPKRAIAAMGDVLKPDSRASETLKQEILRAVRSPRLFASQGLTYGAGFGTNAATATTSSAAAAKSSEGGENVALLRETLVKSFQGERNQKIRREIIYTLASLDDEQATAHLKNLYLAENDREVKKAIINAFSGSGGLFYTSGYISVEGTITAKQKAGLDSPQSKTHQIKLDTLLEIFRAEQDLELRRLAFSNLSRFRNWTAGEQAVGVMSRLYDAETDEELKISIIRALAESGQTPATRKLFDIARNEKSNKLRLEAVYSLRTSKDPEVLKFLEELIR